jgi:hypothetical protein
MKERRKLEHCTFIEFLQQLQKQNKHSIIFFRKDCKGFLANNKTAHQVEEEEEEEEFRVLNSVV